MSARDIFESALAAEHAQKMTEFDEKFGGMSSGTNSPLVWSGPTTPIKTSQIHDFGSPTGDARLMLQSFGLDPATQYETDQCLRFHEALAITTNLTGICDVVSLISRDDLLIGNVLCVIHRTT